MVVRPRSYCFHRRGARRPGNRGRPRMTVERLGARDIPVAELTYFPGNARRGNLPEIRKSVKRLGQYRSVVVRHTPDGLTILAGNHTVRAMTAEGHQTAYCDVIRCTDDEAYGDVEVNFSNSLKVKLGVSRRVAAVSVADALDPGRRPAAGHARDSC